MEQKSLFITLEGVEGSGKSTLVPYLVKKIESETNKSVYLTREPGGTPLGEDIRKLLFHYHDTMSPETELLLFLSARSDLIRLIEEEMSKGKIVVADRFMDSTFVYQGLLNNLGLEKTISMNNFAIKGINPTHTFVLLIPYEESVRRLSNRDDNGKYDNLNEEGFYKIYNGYKKLAEVFPDRIHLLDGTKTTEMLIDEILKIIGAF